MDVVSLQDKLGRVREFWSPKIVGELNETYVKVVKFQGEFVWHHHDNEDELFLVVEGRLRMQFRDGDLDLGPGEFIIVPRGVEHCPKALTDEVQSAQSPTLRAKGEKDSACRSHFTGLTRLDWYSSPRGGARIAHLGHDPNGLVELESNEATVHSYS